MNRMGIPIPELIFPTQTETTILRRVWKAAACRGWTLFRNNIGLAYYPDGSRVQYGLCPGSADLVGWRTVRITEDMVGKDIAQFVGVEVKTPTGRLRKEQRNWLDRAKEAGALIIVARGEGDLDET